MTRSPSRNTTRQAAITTAITRDQAAEPHRIAAARPASRIVAVIAPGPAISGMASGKAAMLRTCSSTRLLGLLGLRARCARRTPFRRRSRTAAARRRCGRPAAPMPSCRSSQSPISAAPIRISARDQAGAHRDLPARRRRQACGDREEDRHEPDRIDHDQQRHQGGDEKLDRHAIRCEPSRSRSGRNNGDACRQLRRRPPRALRKRLLRSLKYTRENHTISERDLGGVAAVNQL